LHNNNLIILFLADIVGKPGLDITTLYLSGLIKKYNADLVIANGENASGGKSITPELAGQYHSLGIDVITGGNHTWDNYKVHDILKTDPFLLRPANYPKGLPGKGYAIFTVKSGQKVAVLNLQGRTFMQDIDCPFQASQYFIEKLKAETQIIVVDFHAEATAEKLAMGWYLDGKVSAMIGTHTHVPTADNRVLPHGTAYITDVGMTGPHDSVIGMKKEVSIRRFTLQTPHKYEMATEDVRLQGVVVEIETKEGKALGIERISLP
jgi:metallophosphoesterase (TIGR00282 family)